MSSLSIPSCKVQSNDSKIEEIFSRMCQWLIFLDTVYFIHYDACLPTISIIYKPGPFRLLGGIARHIALAVQ